MKTLIVYDSVHGNTEKIAASIRDALAGEVALRRVGDVRPSEVQGVDLLIVGSPTLGGRPTKALQDFLKGLPHSSGADAAAFDTRFSAKWVRVFGYAAQRIAAALKAKGYAEAAQAEGFFVSDKEGPLQEGELERAANWAKTVVERRR